MASALLLGIGAALGDAFFAGVAALGLGFIKSLLNANQHVLRYIGGAFMIGFGILLWRQSPQLNDPEKPLSQAHHLAIAIFLMTLTNPATIVWFIAAFAMFRFEAIGHATPSALINSSLLVIGVFTGSMLWWLILSGFVSKWRSKISDQHLMQMNHIAAAILMITGAVGIIITKS